MNLLEHQLRELEKEDIFNPNEQLLDYENSKTIGQRLGMKAIRYLWGKSNLSKLYTSVFGNCPMEPHCSKYTYLSIGEHGLIEGIILGIKRIEKCNPAGWETFPEKNEKPYDPVPTNRFK